MNAIIRLCAMALATCLIGTQASPASAAASAAPSVSTAASASSPSVFCSSLIGQCNLMSEWGVMWQAVSVILTFGISCVGVYKVVQELRRLNEQRAKDAHDKETASLLKRVEFFLAQHRRLFDNPELYGVLCLLDSDDVELARPDMADKKRKFLTFVEEIALLVNTKQIDADVAHYMFGYYAACARHGANFSEGLALERQYWRLFYDFTDAAEAFLERNPDGPAKLSL